MKGSVADGQGSGLTAQSLELAEALVIRTESGFHRVLVDGRQVVARLPKRLIRGERTKTTPVVIGDRVRVREQADGTGVIEEVLERRNELVRGAAGGSRFLDVIAANLDQLVVVHSLSQPDFNPYRIDRFLLIAEAAEVPALVVLNKLDLVDRQGAEGEAEVYRSAGYRVLLTSALDLKGIDEVTTELAGKTSALVGPSGVGKSSLLNDVQPGLGLRTREISEATGKGRHTTTTAELLALDVGGWVADTPGLRELAIREIEPEDLEWLYPEFRPLQGQCRFFNCLHAGEVGCAIRSAVDSRSIHPDRYKSYLRVLEDLKAERDNRYKT